MTATGVGAVLRRATEDLRGAGVPDPVTDARLLACHVLGCSPAQLALRGGELFPAHLVPALDEVVARRVGRQPLQLIVGSVGFRYLELEVRAGVFIPRPETEILAGEAVVRLPAGGTAVEPCTGTGAVACSLASEAHRATVIATDVSTAAVALARDNAARCGVDVDVREGDLLDPVSQALRGRVDVLVSNPPYLAEAEVTDLPPEVADHDPAAALVAGPSGHEVSDRLIALAGEWLKPGGWLLMEVDERRAVEATARCAAAGLIEAAVVVDLTGRDRVVVARRA